MYELYEDIEIIDAHMHVPSKYFMAHQFYEKIGENIYSAISKYIPRISKESILTSLDESYEDHEAEKLVKDMNEAGIKKGILLLPDFTYALRDMEYNIEDQIKMHIDIIEKNPDRFYLFAGVDPRWGREGFDIFEKYVSQKKINGMKVYTPCGYYPNDKNMTPYYELCSELHIPVLFHTGPTSPIFRNDLSMVYLFDEIAYRYPEMNIILAHGGVNNVDAAAEMCAFRPNVYLDISGYMLTLDPNGPIAAVKSLLKRKINHKIIFGTDWPIGGYKNKYKGIVNSLLKPEHEILTKLSKKELKMILSDNIKQLLYV